MATKTVEFEHDLIWGSKAIAQEINRTVPQTFYMLERGSLPGEEGWRAMVRQSRGASPASICRECMTMDAGEPADSIHRNVASAREEHRLYPEGLHKAGTIRSKTAFELVDVEVCPIEVLVAENTACHEDRRIAQHERLYAIGNTGSEGSALVERRVRRFRPARDQLRCIWSTCCSRDGGHMVTVILPLSTR